VSRDFRKNQYHSKSITIDGIHTGALEEFRYEIVSLAIIFMIDQIGSSVRITGKV